MELVEHRSFSCNIVNTRGRSAFIVIQLAVLSDSQIDGIIEDAQTVTHQRDTRQTDVSFHTRTYYGACTVYVVFNYVHYVDFASLGPCCDTLNKDIIVNFPCFAIYIYQSLPIKYSINLHLN